MESRENQLIFLIFFTSIVVYFLQMTIFKNKSNFRLKKGIFLTGNN